MTQIWALCSRLAKQPTDRRRRHHYLRDGALGWRPRSNEESIIATAESLVRLGLLKVRPKKPLPDDLEAGGGGRE